MNTASGVVLLVLGLVVFNQVRQGTLSEWIRSKALNAADPIRVQTKAQGSPIAKPDDGGAGKAGPSGWARPIEAPTISPYGVCRGGGCSRRHQGVDIGGYAYKGQPIRACRGGTVDRVAGNGMCGLRVYVDHGGGDRSMYCHLDRIDVSVGDKVNQGTPVGTCGNTGNAGGTPPHVHLEIWVGGRRVDPGTVLPAFASFTSDPRDRIPADAHELV